MDKQHHYQVRVVWTGNQGTGTSHYQGYARAHDIIAPGKPTIPGSADPAFRGDPTRWNPEDLLLASIAACHKLWYLSLCAQAGVIVTAYDDNAEALMIEHPNGAGEFRSVTLRPHITIAAASNPTTAQTLHHQAHAMCFIARSVNFPIHHEPTIIVAP